MRAFFPASLFFLTLAISGTSGPAWGEEVRIPCGDEKTGLSDCKEVKDRTVKLVSDRATEVVEDWYQGKDFYPRTCSWIFCSRPDRG